MSTLKLTPTHLKAGVWHALLRQTGQGEPQVRVTYANEPVSNVELAETEVGSGTWDLRIPVPKDAIADGMHTVIVADAQDGDVLGHFSLMAGDTLGDDMRAEISLLRGELDLLKRAFRRHCADGD